MPSTVLIESVHQVPQAPEELWPVLSRTDWLNRSLKLPPVEYATSAASNGGSTVMGQASVFGFETAWEEKPFEWLRPYFYSVERHFMNGPFVRARLGVHLKWQVGNQTRIELFAEVEPRNILGVPLARWYFGRRAKKQMAQVLIHIGQHLEGTQASPLPRLRISRTNEDALRDGLNRLSQMGLTHPLIMRLERVLAEAPDVELTAMRPFAYARFWGMDPGEVARLFLYASKSGLLQFSWEVLCPNCRSSRQEPLSRLARLQSQGYCDVCQQRYDNQFDRTVELKFSVHPMIRTISRELHCLGGPGNRPHILGQWVLQPLERRPCTLPQLTGPHQWRSPQVKGAPVALTAEGFRADRSTRVICHPELVLCEEEAPSAGGPGVILHNPNNYEVQLCLERADWDDEILTAARVTSLQEFRDLFRNEILSPNEPMSVGQQVILFTKVRGSTAVYCGIGDAASYALVREHFRILEEVIRHHRGCVVKTIGDSVMAVFCSVEDSLAAVHALHRAVSKAESEAMYQDTGFMIKRIQNAFESQGREAALTELQLKSSLHVGACLAVTANEKLDYFGTTINYAARLLETSQGGDVVISADIFNRPETQQYLQEHSLVATEDRVTFSGFEAPVRVWKIALLGAQAPVAEAPAAA